MIDQNNIVTYCTINANTVLYYKSIQQTYNLTRKSVPSLLVPSCLESRLSEATVARVKINNLKAKGY